MKVRWWVGAGLSMAILTGAATPASAQVCDSEELSFDCPEAWGMKFYTSVSLFTGFGVPERRPAGSFDIGFEGALVPQLSDDQRRLGFNGTKLEDTNKTPVFGRLRGTLYLPAGLSVSAGVVPPLEVGGAKATLLDVAVGLPILDGPRFHLGARAYGQVGSVEGDITCDAETVSFGTDPLRNPFDCEEPSEDEVTQRYAGLELSGAWPLGRVEPYVAGSVNVLDMAFAVRARYSGITDRRTLKASGTSFAGTAGLRVQATDRLTLAGEVFYSPLNVDRPSLPAGTTDALLNLRAFLSYRVR